MAIVAALPIALPFLFSASMVPDIGIGVASLAAIYSGHQAYQEIHNLVADTSSRSIRQSNDINNDNRRSHPIPPLPYETAPQTAVKEKVYSYPSLYGFDAQATYNLHFGVDPLVAPPESFSNIDDIELIPEVQRFREDLSWRMAQPNPKLFQNLPGTPKGHIVEYLTGSDSLYAALHDRMMRREAEESRRLDARLDAWVMESTRRYQAVHEQAKTGAAAVRETLKKMSEESQKWYEDHIAFAQKTLKLKESSIVWPVSIREFMEEELFPLEDKLSSLRAEQVQTEDLRKSQAAYSSAEIQYRTKILTLEKEIQSLEEQITFIQKTYQRRARPKIKSIFTEYRNDLLDKHKKYQALLILLMMEKANLELKTIALESSISSYNIYVGSGALASSELQEDIFAAGRKELELSSKSVNAEIKKVEEWLEDIDRTIEVLTRVQGVDGDLIEELKSDFEKIRQELVNSRKKIKTLTFDKKTRF